MSKWASRNTFSSLFLLCPALLACQDKSQNQYPEELKNCPRVKFDYKFDEQGNLVGLKTDKAGVECAIKRQLFSHREGYNPIRATFYFQAMSHGGSSDFWTLEAFDSERMSATNRGAFSARELDKIFSLLLEQDESLFIRKRHEERMIVKFEPEYWRKLNEVSKKRRDRALSGDSWRPRCYNASDFYDCSSLSIGVKDNQKLIRLSIPIFNFEHYISGSLEIRDGDTYCEAGSLNYRIGISAISVVANNLFKQPDEVSVQTCIHGFEGQLILNEKIIE